MTRGDIKDTGHSDDRPATGKVMGSWLNSAKEDMESGADIGSIATRGQADE